MQGLDKSTPVRDRTWYYTDLAMMPPEAKESAVWCAQMLFFQKLNSRRLVDPNLAARYRRNSNLDINAQVYKNILDPVTPNGGGGTASYIAADWKALPIATHLRNIRRAKLQKIGIINQLQVNEINKYSKSQRQKAKDKIIHQENFRELITIIAKDLGLPPLSKSETAEEYIAKLEGKESGKVSDDVSRIMEQIQLQIKNDKDLALYERYVYKGEIERAFELGLQHYLINQNKWKTKSQYYIEDIENFNTFTSRCYVDKLTGRLEVQYLDPSTVQTSPFHAKDGEDIMYWNYEFTIPFADFIRQFGTTLTDEELKEIFLLNKSSGGGHGFDWTDNPNRSRNNAMILVGFSSVLTQDTEKFSESFMDNPSPTWEKKNITWQPDKESATEKQKIYNVWQSFYYIPPPQTKLSSNSLTDWSWQSRFIFNIEKDIDMYRYGIDRRYAKSSLVMWQSKEPSCTDIEEAIMPKIHTLWHKFQNAIVQDMSGVAIDEDFFLGILNAVDESNNADPHAPNNNKSSAINAGLEAFRQLKQGGVAMLKFRDKNGNPIPGLKPSDFFVDYDNKQLDKAEKYLQLILQQYELLKISLAQSDVTEGQTGRPRTTVTAIEAAIESSNNAQWFVEYPVRECLIMHAERFIQHIIYIVKERKKYGYTKRWDSLAEVIGKNNALMLEGVEEIPIEDFGMTVSLEDTQQLKEWIFALANEMAKNNQVSYEAVGLVVDVSRFNWKYAYAILCMAINEKAEENAAQQQILFEQQKQLKELDLQTALALVGGKSQARQQEIMTESQEDAKLAELTNQLKYQSQADLKQQTTQSRILENDEKEKSKTNAEVQKALI